MEHQRTSHGTRTSIQAYITTSAIIASRRTASSPNISICLWRIPRSLATRRYDIDRLPRVAGCIGVLNAQNEGASSMPGIEPVEQSSAGPADMQEPRRTWRKAYAWFHARSLNQNTPLSNPWPAHRGMRFCLNNGQTSAVKLTHGRGGDGARLRDLGGDPRE